MNILAVAFEIYESEYHRFFLNRKTMKLSAAVSYNKLAF